MAGLNDPHASGMELDDIKTSIGTIRAQDQGGYRGLDPAQSSFFINRKDRLMHTHELTLVIVILTIQITVNLF